MKLYAIRQEPLVEERKNALKQWLAKPELALLMSVIAARGRVAEQEAIDQAHKASETADTPERRMMIGSAVMQSQRYFDAINILTELQSNPDSWHTLKL